MICPSPTEIVNLLSSNPEVGKKCMIGKAPGVWIYLFDHEIYFSEVFQRPYLYLSLIKEPKNHKLLDHCKYDANLKRNLSFLVDCLETLLQNCCIENPTWMELKHFALFLNAQLLSSEKSNFCNSELTSEIFPGMKTFVVKFLIQMSKDFATKSVEISDQSHGNRFLKPQINDSQRWENSPHPYIFFHEDEQTMSFYGFKLDNNLNLVDERSGKILAHSIMSRALFEGLKRNFVVFNESFDQKTEAQKIAALGNVLGVKTDFPNPDKSYKLTSDNVMKMLAIHMRFRSNIPVIIMGETGSGKTRLVKFLCDIMREGKNVENLLIMKTHGGITEKNVHTMVKKAILQAKKNKKLGVSQTVLFFDEANTTNAIGTIKEIMCDRLLNGVPIPDSIGLQFVAAVNPYREHSDEMIEKLENAGLGYHIKSEKTLDKLGKIPMRKLVYRVRQIPASMFPLIWDFGTLDSATEKKYIIQMIESHSKYQRLNKSQLTEVLSTSQNFMRKQKDECSFVSLRDVERTLNIFQWFQEHSTVIMPKMLQKMPHGCQDQEITSKLNLILALGVAYYARLDKRRVEYEAEISKCLSLEHNFFSKTISSCQDVFLDEMKLDTNIAKNDALKENVWMMAICIDLQIPLFVVGKPGSSKSLAKTLISNAMKGDMQESSKLFRHLKEIHIISFQCSPLSTAKGILSTFRQCQKFQQKRDLTRFTAVCVLDEIGLAEDSPEMPLKTLHPLLEDGCVDLEEPEPYKKVLFQLSAFKGLQLRFWDIFLH